MTSNTQRTIGGITMVVLAAVLGTIPVLAQAPFNPDLYTINSNGEVITLAGFDLPEPPPRMGGGRTETTLLKSYLSFDYWSLRTRGVRDTVGNLHFAAELYEYSNPTSNLDRFVISPDGELLETHLDWAGVGGKAVVTDANGNNVYLRTVATASEHGCVDSANYIHLFSAPGNITYAKLDPAGNTVIDWTTIASGAGAWGGYVQPVVTNTDMLVATWYRSTEDICAVMSTDGGVTWSEIVVLVDRPTNEQTTMLKTVVDADDYVHLVYRSWNFDTSEERIYYTKLCPDWSTVCVGETVFRTSSTWYPSVSLDDAGNLHVSFGPRYQTGTTLVYTCLRGDLDLGGDPATDETLTLIPDQTFITDPDYVRYALNVPDENGTVHVIFEEGEYGRDTDKDLYYTRFACPGDLDADGDVDLSDLAILLSNYGTTSGANRFDGDFDGDGDVDLSDLATLLSVYGSNC